MSHFIVPKKYYVLTLIALIVLTVITVLVAQFDFGRLNIVIAMGVALIKVLFVLSYFMGLKWDDPFNRVIVFGSVSFVALFIAVVLLDAATRSDIYKNEAEYIHIESPVKASGSQKSHH
jgi:cytochrome c oxidase subunit 4